MTKRVVAPPICALLLMYAAASTAGVPGFKLPSTAAMARQELRGAGDATGERGGVRSDQRAGAIARPVQMVLRLEY